MLSTLRSSTSKAGKLNHFNIISYRCFSGKTLFDKVWDSHAVIESDGKTLLYIDRHLVHEVTTPQAFEGLRTANRKLRQPQKTLATPDHVIPTKDRFKKWEDPNAQKQYDALNRNVKNFEVPFFPLTDARQGIVHIIGPEQGFTLPGTTVVCGDSHTSTHGAFGALALGIGTSEVEHVMATQTMWMIKPKSMRITVEGELGHGVTSKDVILKIIGTIGTAGGTGHVIEYAGSVFRNMNMEGRMTVANMSIEAGARAGMIAPDQTTFDYLKGRPMSPKGNEWAQALTYWSSLPSDTDASYDTEVFIDAAEIFPTATWGTSPEDIAPLSGLVPDPESEPNENRRKKMIRSLEYMGLLAGSKMDEISIDKVFIGSCTNGRIEDLRAVAEVSDGFSVAEGVHALVVPGSGLVKKQAEEEGIMQKLRNAGFDVRDPGCSMCLGMNNDQLKPEERCASTSNRNFEGRQGYKGRTHLVSPAVAAASAIRGRLTDPRMLAKRAFSSSPTPQAFEPVTTINDGVVSALDMINIDTDMIIPKQFLTTIERSGLGKSLFFELRYTDSGSDNPEFILNQRPNTSILLGGANFGCGSSREHAVWSLKDFGIRCVIAPSFADIFYNNCFNNGVLPIALSEDIVSAWLKSPPETLSIDLEKQIVIDQDKSYSFDILSSYKSRLLNGLDEIALTLKHEEEILQFERKQQKEQPWLYHKLAI